MPNISLQDAWGWLLSAAAAVYSLSKAFEVISKQFHFHLEDDYKDKIDAINTRIDKLEQKIDSRQKVQDDEFKRLHEQTGILCQAMFAQLNHELSGNDVALLRSSRDLLQKA